MNSVAGLGLTRDMPQPRTTRDIEIIASWSYPSVKVHRKIRGLNHKRCFLAECLALGSVDVTPQVLEFAKKLQSCIGHLTESRAVECHLSDDPVPYLEAVATMEARVAAIHEGAARELIWFVEHPPVYTAGTSAKAADLLGTSAIPVYQTGRGGQYTYHGPGQLVAYVMLDLNKGNRDVRCFVHRLEGWVLAALSEYGVQGKRVEGRPGIWVGEGRAKIAAVGVRVRRWVTFHGVAVNICPNLSHFEGIVPCGIADAGVTSLAAIKSRRVNG